MKDNEEYFKALAEFFATMQELSRSKLGFKLTMRSTDSIMVTLFNDSLPYGEPIGTEQGQMLGLLNANVKTATGSLKSLSKWIKEKMHEKE